jgi:exodeoxyribonuclease VII large subunit
MVSSNFPFFDDPLNQSQQPQDVLSVSSLNKMARSLLEANFPAVVVEGEISNLARPASGHWYLTLKDKSAQIRCAMFAGQNRLIRFQPENGQQVLVRGRLSLYEGRGDYQLIVNSMEEAGDGALQRAFEQLKAKLLAEGLFEAHHKKKIESNYKHIGLVTSATGAAVHDMITVFARRSPTTKLTLIPVAVQGAAAANEIVNAIELANRLADTLQLDALIVGRGGGSLEDLQAFNDERVARAIFASQLPITSAVGHEVDFSIADFVADMRAPTPSAAAELMSTSQQELLESAKRAELALVQLVNNKLGQWAQQVIWLTRQLKHPGRRLQEHAQTLDSVELRMLRAARSKIQNSEIRLRGINQRLRTNSPTRRFKQTASDLALNNKRLKQAWHTLLNTKNAQIVGLVRGLNAVSPLNTLARGYSITFDESAAVVRDVQSLTKGSLLVTQLESGKITSVVETIKSNVSKGKQK